MTDVAPVLISGFGGLLTALTIQLIPIVRWLHDERLASRAQRQDWDGTPARHDGSGNVVTPAMPGVMAQLTAMRAQLASLNSKLGEEQHVMRWDIDRIGEKVSGLQQVVDGHIHMHLGEYPRAGPPRQGDAL